MSFSVIDEIVSGTKKKKKKTSYETMEAPGNGPGSTREQREGLKPFQLISREVCTNTSTVSEKEKESRTSLLERWWIRRRSCTSCLADTEPASAAAFAARWGPDHLCPFSLDKIRKILCIYRYTCGQITWTLFPLTHPEFCLRLGTNFTNCDSPRLRPPQRWTPVICLQRVWGV